MWGQAMTSQVPPAPVQATGAQAEATGNPAAAPEAIPDTASAVKYPQAYVVPAKTRRDVTIDSRTQSEHDGVVSLEGEVVIVSGDRTVRADHIDWDTRTGDVTASGHMVVEGGEGQEYLSASHGTYNLKNGTGQFFDVKGSVAVKARAPQERADVVPSDPTYTNASRVVYSNGNPFLFEGRMVTKTGDHTYDIYDGSVTSCQLPKPDWLLSGQHFAMDEDKARASNSVFRLFGVPLLYLPYVTHPVDSEDRQSGFLIPVVGESSTKGLILGEQIYMVINRSSDLVVGADYYSSRGFAQNATFRYRGRELDFVNVHYSGLLDRGYTPVGGVYTNQGGEDVVFAGRRDFTDKTRAAANVEYLSSYIYREAFTDNFNQAVTSDVVSTAFLSHHDRGFEVAGLADRYQGIKVIAQGTGATATPQQEVRLFHVPSLSFGSTDHRLSGSGLEWTFDATASGLKRTQPNFATGGIVERLDLHPQVAYPFSLGAWRFRGSVATRDTLYSRSRVTPVAGVLPQQSNSGLVRADFETEVDIRPPVLEKTFQPTRLKSFFGEELRHTIEPEITYRRTAGVNNFLNVLRFDETDVVADRDEAQFGVTQRLYRKVKPKDRDKACRASEQAQGGGLDNEAAAAPAPSTTPGKGCGNEELISWRLTQKYFFDPTFGHAVQNGRRNLFDSTLDLSGVAFLTEPREISPLVSRLRVRASANTDVEWDFDYDTGAKKFTANNIFVDVHRNATFGALSFARLDAPGRAYIEGVSSTVASFEQMRVLFGFGQPSKPGLSAAANAGFDLCPAAPGAAPTTSGTTATPSSNCNLLQYAAIQTSYNWNCCGLAIEYRKYELGAVRNEGVYRFNFTLANIATAGNLRRAERLF